MHKYQALAKSHENLVKKLQGIAIMAFVATIAWALLAALPAVRGDMPLSDLVALIVPVAVCAFIAIATMGLLVSIVDPGDGHFYGRKPIIGRILAALMAGFLCNCVFALMHHVALKDATTSGPGITLMIAVLVSNIVPSPYRH